MLFLCKQFFEIFPNFISRLYDVFAEIYIIAVIFFYFFFYIFCFCFYKEQKYHCESFVSGRTRGFCVMHRQHTRRGSRPGGAARMKRGGRWMLLDRNLASVVRDAPYAVDHLSARSQRPIISRDTCASLPDKKRRYVSRRVFVEKVLPQRVTEKFRASFGTDCSQDARF